MSEPGAELVARQPDRPQTDTWVDVIRPVITLSEHVADTEFVPRSLRSNAPAIAAAILHGRELGLSPMTALAQLHVVEGKPTLSAEGQRGLVLAAGHEIEPVELTDAVCTYRGRRFGAERWTSVTWTMDRARVAGLANRGPWKNYPRAMLAARASAELCRLIFPDVLHGMTATEELDGDAPTVGEAQPAAGRRTRTVARLAPGLAPPAPAAPEAPAAAPTAAAELPPAPDDTDPAEPEPVTDQQLKLLGLVWSRFGVTDGERRDITGQLVERDLAGTTKNLTRSEARGVIVTLTDILRAMVDPASDDVLGETVDAAEARDRLERYLGAQRDAS